MAARSGDAVKVGSKAGELLARGPAPHYGLSRNQVADLIAAATAEYPSLPCLKVSCWGEGRVCG